MKILVTSTSFQDTPGNHHAFLKSKKCNVDFMRGPLNEYELLNVIDKYDGLSCGDDDYTSVVLEKGFDARLRVISKYGVGLDKIDLDTAQRLNIVVKNCPGINQNSVAEHVLALLLCYSKNIHLQYNSVQNGSWERISGEEIINKTIGIIGLGAIGKEVALKCFALGLIVYVYDVKKDVQFLKANPKIYFAKNLIEIYNNCEIISLHVPHNENTHQMINSDTINNLMLKNPILINTARGKLVDSNAVVDGIENNKIKAYLCDVLDVEPIKENEVLKGKKNIIITPHIGSRTIQNVENQAIMAIKNLFAEFDRLNLKTI